MRTGDAEKPAPPREEPIEYTDASGKLKFNKRREKGSEGGKGSTKKAKRAKLAKLNNAKLLSFGDEDDG